MTRPEVFCGDLKIFPWFEQSYLFSSSLTKTKEGSARRVGYPLRKRANSHQNGSYHTSNVQRAKRHTIIIKHNFLHPKLSRPPFLNRGALTCAFIARALWNATPQQDGKFAGRLISKSCLNKVNWKPQIHYGNVHDQLHFDRFFYPFKRGKIEAYEGSLNSSTVIVSTNNTITYRNYGSLDCWGTRYGG